MPTIISPGRAPSSFQRLLGAPGSALGCDRCAPVAGAPSSWLSTMVASWSASSSVHGRNRISPRLDFRFSHFPERGACRIAEHFRLRRCFECCGRDRTALLVAGFFRDRRPWRAPTYVRNISVLAEASAALGDALAHGFTRHRQRRLADLFLALWKMKIERAARRARQPPECRTARCRDNPAGGRVFTAAARVFPLESGAFAMHENINCISVCRPS